MPVSGRGGRTSRSGKRGIDHQIYLHKKAESAYLSYGSDIIGSELKCFVKNKPHAFSSFGTDGRVRIAIDRR